MNPIVELMAVHRLTKLIVEDEITRPAREAVFHWADDAKQFSLRERIATAIDCPACSSIWAGGLVLLASRSRLGRAAIGVLAISSASLAFDALVKRLERQ